LTEGGWETVEKQHSHLGALYRVARSIDDTFVVVVTIPGARPVDVPGFISEDIARAWISSHERGVAAGTVEREKLNLLKRSN
jgi:hypothetical protein